MGGGELGFGGEEANDPTNFLTVFPHYPVLFASHVTSLPFRPPPSLPVGPERKKVHAAA